MRKVALVPDPTSEVRRLIMFETPDGTYLFLSRDVGDCGSLADDWYASVSDAEASASKHFGVAKTMWNDVPDPLAECQHDWIAPVRVPGRDVGKPEWGKLERLENGVWVPFNPKER